jgi:hypothetical protein
MMDISESIERAVSAYFTQWLFAHPYLAWTIAHPLLGLGLSLLTIFSLWGLIKAIGRGIEQIWLMLLTTPFRLLQPILRGIWSSIARIFGHTKIGADRLNSQVKLDDPTERVAAIVDRLHSLSHEQQLLLQELATLTGSTPVGASIDNTSDTQYKNMSARLLKSQ